MIKILADSTCDLSKEVLEKYNICIAPLTICIKDKDYRDRIDITPDEFYGFIEDLDTPPTTSMPSPAEYLKIFKKAIQEGHHSILCICMSSGTSGSYQSAVIARDYFLEEHPEMTEKIHVLDSKCMSHGSGWLILKSARMRERGVDFAEIVEFNETYKTSVKHYLSVDDLDHLIRSGRLTNASAFVGKLLKLKPIMTMKKGKGAIVAKERGRKKVLEHYVSEFSRRVDYELTDFIIIGYTSDLTFAENLKHKIERDTPYMGEIYIMQMGVAVGTHVGLGAISMFFMEKGRIKDNLLINEVHGLAALKNQFLRS
ncbi:EDD domain protein, DegV family [Desulfitobacterium dehalogenans ATCC 51507]|uniref:EDD domain protein, DegV family n=1 Tax=Desulfitobacterium dehalogenans (strain ATCC 51507 / DSM 9161 / JW/IU-DC1) TaxID=756499 RepID=I4A8F7_DESDJ|nr:DegV family protein [Desulfitobacterium dehalogenans]AFM00242.1 EDD domain protein, DegV family [Desulfitobacterium dehalogenans ATCC 51507]